MEDGLKEKDTAESDAKVKRLSSAGSASSSVSRSANQQVNISHANIQNLTFASGEAGLNPENERPPTSIKRVRQPIEGLRKTETYEEILKKIQEESFVILHCHGIPGSGKSQLVRKMAEEFPFVESKDDLVVVKWHVQCKDSGHNLLQELKGLAERLLKNSFNVTQETYQNVVDNLNIDQANALVEILAEIRKPVLIIVEDPGEKDQKLLHSLCRNLNSHSEKPDLTRVKIHVYISSRKSTVILSGKQKYTCYKLERVQGFNEEEAIKYLNGGLTEEKKDAARRIYNRFSGLPLGLHAAKCYCKIARIDYLEYFDLVEDLDYDIINEERQATVNEYGDSAEHVFQALVMPFVPNEESDTVAILAWKILCCISYFHYDRIPRFALEQCCHVLRDRKVKNPHIKNKVEIGTLISKLRDYGMCTETDEGEVTFHEVVLNAFRLNQNSELSDFKPLKKATEIMSSLVSKDMRKKQHASRMYKLRRHLQALLKHIESDEQIFDDEDELLLKALTSHLHETAAAIMLNESPLFWKESDKHFEKALLKIWPDMTEYIELEKCDEREDEMAQKIVEKSRNFQHPSPDFTRKYASKLDLCFEEDELEFLKSKTTSKSSFSDVKRLLKSKGSTEDLIAKLQACDLFLSDERYRPIFYAERLAFILHSWSRLVLYADPDDVKEIGERCVCMSNLSSLVSIECRKTCGIPLLAEHLSKTGGRIPISLKLKESKEILQKALVICKDAMEEQNYFDAYENGLIKQVYGSTNVSSRIYLLRYIVRINAKLHKVASPDIVAEADERCEELFSLSVKHAQTISMSLMCIIYCAKYYAAKRDFSKAFECFQKYFELEEKCKPRFNVRCWAIYNNARAISEDENSPNELKSAILQKCEKILNRKDVMNKSLKLRISKCRSSLQV